jgi:hypothetical protein
LNSRTRSTASMPSVAAVPCAELSAAIVPFPVPLLGQLES